jgi:hypothetical protein
MANVIAREHNKKEKRKYMYLSPIFQQQIAISVRCESERWVHKQKKLHVSRSPYFHLT